MNPPEDTLQDIATSNEALLLHSLESEKTLKSIDTGLDSNAVATQQNTESIKDVEGAVEARIAQAENHKNEMMPSIEAIGKAMTFASALLEKLEGPQGPQGEKGDKGDTGEKGETVRGPQGEKGESGLDGMDGSDGRDGVNGKDGRDGRDGKDGKDSKSEIDYKKIIKEVVKQIPKLDVDEKVKQIIDKVSINTNDTIQSIRTQKLSSQSVSMGDLTDAKNATTGQTMVKQADGTWAPATASGGGGMTVTIPTGLVNGSNTSYSSTTLPKLVVTEYGTLVNESIMQNPGISGFTYTGTGPYNISLPMAPNNFAIVYS